MTTVEQARLASEKLQEAEKMKTSAVQEAVYYHAKVTALEAAAHEDPVCIERDHPAPEAAVPEDLIRVEHDRLVILERQLSLMLAEHAEEDEKISELSNSLALAITLLEQAETRAIDASKRADLLEDSHEEKLWDLADLQERHILLEADLMEHVDQLLSLTSQLEQEAGLANSQGQVEELSVSKEQRIWALEKARVALQSASTHAEEINTTYKE